MVVVVLWKTSKDLIDFFWCLKIKWGEMCSFNVNSSWTHPFLFRVPHDALQPNYRRNCGSTRFIEETSC